MGWELFKNYLIAKEKFKPDFFLYENNKSASQAIKDQIAEEFGVGVDPKVRFTYINSALVSAQNRQRFYVTNFGDIEQPEDRGILLKDILERGDTDREKAHAVISSAGRTTTREYFDKQQGNMSCEPVRIPEYGDADKARPVNAYYSNNCGGFEHRMFNPNPAKQQVDMIAVPVETDEMTPPCDPRGRDQARTLSAGYSMCSQRDLRMDIETDGFMGKQGCIEAVGAIPVNETVDGKAQCVRAACYKDTIRNLVANDYDKRTCVAEPVNVTPDGKSQTIKAQYQNTSTVNVCCYKSTYGATGVAEPVNETSDGKSHTVKAQYYKNGTANFVTNGGFGASGVAEPIRVGSLPRPNGELSTSQAMQIYSQEGKSTTQMSGGGGLGGKTGLYAIPVEFEDGVPTKAVSCADGKTYTVYEVKDGKITIKGKEYPIKLKDGYYIIRKLTVRECARLQTMPDDYCKSVSDSQAYKALGNGWTAEVIIHLLNHALKDVPRDEEIIVLSMYDGIATGRYCLDKMGFTNVTYHAYEIDKYPIMVAMDNYPDIIQHGDAFAVREDDWKPPQTRSEWLDDLLGGDL